MIVDIVQLAFEKQRIARRELGLNPIQILVASPGKMALQKKDLLDKWCDPDMCSEIALDLLPALFV